MLKIYMVNGLTYQFEEGEQPEGAVEVKQTPVAEQTEKAKKPANKARKAATK